MQNLVDDKNKLYDEFIDFENLNKVGKLICFKQLSHNLVILYARRIVLSLIEKNT